MKIVVYTCITGDYEKLNKPSIIDERLEYYCFSDNPNVVIEPWEYKAINLPSLNAKDQNRYLKMHPQEFFPNHDITVYIDGSMQIVGDLYELIMTTLPRHEEIFVYDHPIRNCVYEEAVACIHYSHDWIWKIVSQMRRYRKECYPANNGLFEAGVIICKNSHAIKQLMEDWWYEYKKGAARDQLSFPVVAWRLGLVIGSLGKSDPRFIHNYFRFINHPKRSIKLMIRKHINRKSALIFSYYKLFGVHYKVK